MAANTKFSDFSPAAISALPTVTKAERKPKLRPQLPPLPLSPEPSFVLYKQRTWSPDIDRDEEWARLKRNQQRRFRNHSANVVTISDDDMKELKAGIDLGFGFDTPNLDPKLSRNFPALHLYSAVNRLSRSSSSVSSETEMSSMESPSDSSPNLRDFFDPSDGPEKMKVKLRQWAQAVACSVREAAPAKLPI